ncbi:hypothetical protein MJA45_18510 [Paenibacillus aurantius]|uniref:Uncharacterized protein n=1 Tax=Paenibacillus aurantius TaxID=2918900 RepID=A0AA96LAG7_9BACL|nr:hypothetical protein [Paenibacillus aurantius]WNQ09615.1 hypothetical protein MJA45_18510 [Paenibacillus aurantius]
MKSAINHTLGAKQKRFEWYIDSSNNVSVKRDFHEYSFSAELISAIHNFVKSHPDTPLANNVSKLGNGTEVEGIGKFILESLELTVAEAQLASQLAAIFCKSGVWISNGKVRGMRFSSLKACGHPHFMTIIVRR